MPYGEDAFKIIGEEKCLSHLLNSPGNFTASKLAWVKKNEPEIFDRTEKIMLPGDYIAMKFTGASTTSISALSEGIFWDFKSNSLSEDVMSYFGFDNSIIPTVQDVFSDHGELNEITAAELSLTPNIPVTYKAGDQPNNALSLNVLQPGEVAATAGTSGVIYGISDQLTYDKQSRVNTFAHVNYTSDQKHLGVLLCINGVGILNKWIKNICKSSSYKEIDDAAKKIKPGSDGLIILPFGNGAERMLNNKTVGANFHAINFNIHTPAHLQRAAQEGIAFSFRYGLDIMRENGMNPTVIRAGKANMFLSKVFTEAFVNATNVPVKLYENDGSVGAAIGAGIGAKIFTAKEAFANLKQIDFAEPMENKLYDELYFRWKKCLENDLKALEEANLSAGIHAATI